MIADGACILLIQLIPLFSYPSFQFVLQAISAAETAIELCILIKRAEVLWEEVYPRFHAHNQQGLLLDALLPHILASKLPSFPPEVMQVAPSLCVISCSVAVHTEWDAQPQTPLFLLMLKTCIPLHSQQVIGQVAMQCLVTVPSHALESSKEATREGSAADSK